MSPLRATLEANLKNIQSRIHEACEKAHRDPATVELLPATKGHPPSTLLCLYEMGFRRFGENYVQEMQKKADALRHLPHIQWVYMGRLQSNKLIHLVTVSNEVLALESISHAKRLAQCTSNPLKVWIAVNGGGEAQKTGLPWEEVAPFYTALQAWPILQVQGIFSLPPAALPEKEQAELYEKLGTLASTIGEKKLSLGMSQDLETAILAGSTMVRVGTALLGPRTL